MFYLDDHTGHYQLDVIVKTNCSAVRDMYGVEMADSFLVSYICLSEDGLAKEYKSNVLHFEPSISK